MSLEARALEIGHPRAPLFGGAEFQLPAGECWAIVGRNGCGKTTLLLTLAGLLAPLGGAVAVNGRDLAQWRRANLARHLGFLPQHQPAVFPFTVEEFVAFGRLPWREARRRGAPQPEVEAALATLELGDLRLRPLTGLSGGEVQRVCIAQLLAQTTDNLLLDEPMAHLDLLHQIRVMRLLRGLAEQGRAIAVVTHDLALAWRSCHRLLVLGPGTPRLLAPGDNSAGEIFRWAFDLEFTITEDGPRPLLPCPTT